MKTNDILNKRNELVIIKKIIDININYIYNYNIINIIIIRK
jgi:hypothetical protein